MAAIPITVKRAFNFQETTTNAAIIRFFVELWDGTVIVVQASDPQLQRWNPINQELLTTFEVDDGSIVASVAQIDESTIAVGCSNKTIQLWDIHSGKCLFTKSVNRLVTMMKRLKCNPSWLLCWIGYSGFVEIRTSNKALELLQSIDDHVTALCELADGTLMTLHKQNDTCCFKLWDLNQMSNYRELITEMESGIKMWDISQIQTLRDQNTVVIMFNDCVGCSIKLWDATTRQVLYSMNPTNESEHYYCILLTELATDNTLAFGLCDHTNGTKLYLWGPPPHKEDTNSLMSMIGNLKGLWLNQMVCLRDGSLLIGGRQQEGDQAQVSGWASIITIRNTLVGLCCKQLSKGGPSIKEDLQSMLPPELYEICLSFSESLVSYSITSPRFLLFSCLSNFNTGVEETSSIHYK
eukprot:TRINITY_DN1001_c0_g2_i6.p1 TRINITY_DN1001_c0_g2~~TRINITY_DN1001_c0_g2_i6.p1  ORF type:complete len:432 (+),score=78.05 TRINITY_DN1001_c0_g2_i6:71-1297(+)